MTLPIAAKINFFVSLMLEPIFNKTQISITGRNTPPST